MSELAIAAVTATLRSLLYQAVEVQDVTTLPPDRANQGGSGERLNLFLYHVSHNAAWRNQVIPTRAKAGEVAHPPLGLTLHYLITAYGDDQGLESDHILLGRAMLSMHDHAVIAPDKIQTILSGSGRLSESQLERQFEPVRLTPEPLTVDEMSKLWTTFQTQYRVSTAYQASVVLLESKRKTRTPLPVLRRGPENRGVDVTPRMPARLEAVEYRDRRGLESALPAARLGDTITLSGVWLPGVNAQVLVRNPNRQPTPAEPDADIVARLTPLSGSNQDYLYVTLDDFAGAWVSGPLQIMLEERRASGNPRRSAPLMLALAPRIHNESGLTARVTAATTGKQLVVQANPPIARRADGSLPTVMLILTPMGAGEVPDPIKAQLEAPRQEGAPVLRTPVSEVRFDLKDVAPGGYRVRLRIETVESVIMTRNGVLMDFDELQTVRL